ncbi:MAG: hypothetical protein HYY66_00155 [Candidatus Tectomicrobia bacterium]|nr:hypothetical protein [Candidatus Tectomicrobia bacterium]
MLSRYDRMVLSLIALALAVIALNPWVAPGYVSAQGGVMDVNIVAFSGVRLTDYYLKTKATELPGIPVIVGNK